MFITAFRFILRNIIVDMLFSHWLSASCDDEMVERGDERRTWYKQDSTVLWLLNLFNLLFKKRYKEFMQDYLSVWSNSSISGRCNGLYFVERFGGGTSWLTRHAHATHAHRYIQLVPFVIPKISFGPKNVSGLFCSFFGFLCTP